MEKIIGTVPGKCRKKREKARLTLNNNPEISWHMKKSRRTYNGVHLNKKSNTQDVVEQSLTLNVDIHVIAYKVTHLFVQSGNAFTGRSSRCMYRLLLHEECISEKGITQVLIIFLRDKIVRLPVSTVREQFRWGYRQERSVQKRITAPLGAAIRFFLSVP